MSEPSDRQADVKIRPKKWEQFQHYKDRDPTWIKLHRRLLDDFDFLRLHRGSQALAPLLWLLASESHEAIIDADPEYLSFRLRWPVSEISDALSPLIGKGFFEVVQFDSTPLADPERVGSPENINQRRDREETSLVPLTRDDAPSAKAVRQKQALELLEFLNAKAGRFFKPVPANLRLIEARLAEGASLQDLKTLTVRKCRDWLGTDMAKFLRPETLFNATKCQSYLGEIAPEVPQCSVPNATAASVPAKSPAPADGAPPIDSPSPDGQQAIRSMASALGRTLSAGAASSLEH